MIEDVLVWRSLRKHGDESGERVLSKFRAITPDCSAPGGNRPSFYKCILRFSALELLTRSQRIGQDLFICKFQHAPGRYAPGEACDLDRELCQQV